MTNQLIHSNSPYLLQHAENPVDWVPWSPPALKRARREDKPIFLSIGYAACHWCHVMAHESFEDPEVAELMNEHFINIKVDREQRPDLDQIYMKAVVAMTGQGGWPMSVFLTPEGKPFYGGTYFPPQPRGRMPAFRQLLTTISGAWENDRQELLQSADRITEHLQSDQVMSDEQKLLSEKDLTQAVQRLSEGYDWHFGGWGQAPKFPQAMTILFLLTQATRGNQDALEMAVHALDAMAQGGLYDLVGGGFSRYSVDNRWRVPHFEKMLYDNALLARAYLHAHLITGESRHLTILEETLDFLVREMRHPEGGFFSSLDADTEGVEGKYYTWTADEIQRALPDHPHLEIFQRAFEISPEGNFEGTHVLQQVHSHQELAEEFNLPAAEVAEALDEMLHQLFIQRKGRTAPGVDDKVLTSWNGLTLTVFAQAALYLDRPDYAEIAVDNARFLIDNLVGEDGRLKRSWRDGTADHTATLEDYGALIQGLITLYQLDPQPRWFREARRLSGEMMTHYYHPEEGFYDTRDDQDDLLLRPQDKQDNATPSGTSLALQVLLLMAAFSMDFDWLEIGEDTLAAHRERLLNHPTAFANWLTAADFAVGPLLESVIIGDPDHPAVQDFREILRGTFHPRLIIAQGHLPLAEDLPELLHDRVMLDDRPTVYLCRDFVCLQPTVDPAQLAHQLETL